MTRQEYTLTVVQRAFVKWVADVHPTHAITVRQNFKIATDNFEQAEKRFLQYIKTFEKLLCGRRNWFRHPIKFRGCAEQGKTKIWHWHICIKADSVSAKKLRDAANRVREIYDLPKSTMYVKKLKAHKKRFFAYMAKELVMDEHGHFDSRRLVCSETLFKSSILLPNWLKKFMFWRHRLQMPVKH